MRAGGTDRDWRALGNNDPYYAVLTDDPYMSTRLTEDNMVEFMTTGRAYFDELARTMQSYGVGAAGSFERSLDFGCGVGRVTLPIAERSAFTMGVDVSEGMLREARRNANLAGSHARFVQASDRLCFLEDSFDFVHSFIVLQHIHPARGLAILDQLAACLRNSGVGAIHLTYLDHLTMPQRIRYWLYRHVPGLWWAKNTILRAPRRPLIRMYNYNLADVFGVLRKAGCHRVTVRFTDHGGHQGVILLFEKTELPTL